MLRSDLAKSNIAIDEQAKQIRFLERKIAVKDETVDRQAEKIQKENEQLTRQRNLYKSHLITVEAAKDESDLKARAHDKENKQLRE